MASAPGIATAPTPDVEGAAAPSVGEAPGAALVGTPGVAVPGDGAAAAASAPGAAGITTGSGGGTPSAASAGADSDSGSAQRAGRDAPVNVANQLGRSQDEVSGESTEARLAGAAGPEASTGVAGRVETGAAGAGMSGLDVSTQGGNAAKAQDLEARRSTGTLRDQTTAIDPVAEAGRVETLEFNQRDQVAARAGGVEDQGDEAKRIAGDPQAAASGRAGASAGAAVRDRAPLEPNATQSNVNTATSAVRDPQAAASAEVELEVDTREADAKAKLGTKPDSGHKS